MTFDVMCPTPPRGADVDARYEAAVQRLIAETSYRVPDTKV